MCHTYLHGDPVNVLIFGRHARDNDTFILVAKSKAEFQSEWGGRFHLLKSGPGEKTLTSRSGNSDIPRLAVTEVCLRGVSKPEILSLDLAVTSYCPGEFSTAFLTQDSSPLPLWEAAESRGKIRREILLLWKTVNLRRCAAWVSTSHAGKNSASVNKLVWGGCD